MALPWNKRNVQVQIEEMTKQNVPVFAGDMNVDRTGKGSCEVNANVSGVLLTNELGTDGSFEIDSNSDGLADGWIASTCTPSLESDNQRIFGGSVTESSGIKFTNFSSLMKPEHVYYVSIVAKSNNDTYGSRFGVYIAPTSSPRYYSSDVSYFYFEDTVTDYSRKSLIFETTSANYNLFNIRCGLHVGTKSYDFSIRKSGITLIDLTELGKLPYSLRKKYSKNSFYQLTATEMDEAIYFCYINSAESTSWTFDSGEQTSKISNIGKNFFDFDSAYLWKIGGANSAPAFLVGDEKKFRANLVYKDKTILYFNLNGLKTFIMHGTLNYHDRIAGTMCFEIVKKNGTSSITNFPASSGSLSVSFDLESPAVEMKIYNRYTNDWIDFEISDFQIEQGTVATDYEPPKKGEIILPELNGINGVYDDLDYKRIEHEEITITSNAGTTTSSGTGECTLVNDSTGKIYRGTISGTSVTVTAPDGTYQIFYVLSTPVNQDANINLLNKYLNSEHNNYIGESYNSDEFSGDGSTTAFTLSTTADDANYDVFIAGIKQESGVTKTTTNFTFDSAPKNGAIIEAEYNRTTNSSWFATLNVYEPVGTLNNRAYETTISAQSNGTFFESTDQLGNVERVEQSKDYTVNLTFRIFENVKKFSDEWKGKKFRIIIENISETATTYTKDIFAVCEIIDSSVDYIEGTETVTIKATDFYQGVS